jgi:hypothetical protein
VFVCVHSWFSFEETNRDRPAPQKARSCARRKYPCALRIMSQTTQVEPRPDGSNRARFSLSGGSSDGVANKPDRVMNNSDRAADNCAERLAGAAAGRSVCAARRPRCAEGGFIVAAVAAHLADGAEGLRGPRRPPPQGGRSVRCGDLTGEKREPRPRCRGRFVRTCNRSAPEWRPVCPDPRPICPNTRKFVRTRGKWRGARGNSREHWRLCYSQIALLGRT